MKKVFIFLIIFCKVFFVSESFANFSDNESSETFTDGNEETIKNTKECLVPCGMPVKSHYAQYHPETETIEFKLDGLSCVSATANGEVVNVSFSSSTESWIVEIRHVVDKNAKPGGIYSFSTIYEGLQKVTYVQVGSKVNKGFGIGVTKGKNLFYQIYINRNLENENPLPYMFYERQDLYPEHKSITELCRSQMIDNGCKNFENKCGGFKEIASISDNLNFLEAKLKGLASQNETLSNSELSAIDSLIQELFGQVQTQVGQTSQKQTSSFCQGVTLSRNLSVGSRGSDVKCLQSILNSNTPTQVSFSGAGSSGNETEYFGSLTKSAVVKFQELYASEILHPFGLTSGTGFVGSGTRNKLNQLNI